MKSGFAEDEKVARDLHIQPQRQRWMLLLVVAILALIGLGSIRCDKDVSALLQDKEQDRPEEDFFPLNKEDYDDADFFFWSELLRQDDDIVEEDLGEYNYVDEGQAASEQHQ